MLIIESSDKKTTEFYFLLFCDESDLLYNLFDLYNKTDIEINELNKKKISIELEIDHESLSLVKEYFNNNLLKTDTFLDSLNDDELFKLVNASNFLLMENLLDKVCIIIAKKICDNKTSDEIIDKYNLKDYLTEEEIEEIKNEELYNVN